MELGQSKAFCVVDDHDGCFGDVDSYFDNGGRDEHDVFAVFEVLHGLIFFRRFHLSVEESDFVRDLLELFSDKTILLFDRSDVFKSFAFFN